MVHVVLDRMMEWNTISIISLPARVYRGKSLLVSATVYTVKQAQSEKSCFSLTLTVRHQIMNFVE